MTTSITISGKIVHESNGEENVLFVRGRIFSSHRPLAEIVADLLVENGNLISVRYWTSSVELSPDEAKIEWIKKISGFGDAEYQMAYSECTGYLWTDESFNIGGHDMLLELESHIGEYVHLEIDFHDLAAYQLGFQEGKQQLLAILEERKEVQLRNVKYASNPVNKEIFATVANVYDVLIGDVTRSAANEQKRRRR